MDQIERIKSRIIGMNYGSINYGDSFLKKKSFKLLLIEVLRRFKEWDEILEVENNLNFGMNDLANSLNSTWNYNMKEDLNFYCEFMKIVKNNGVAMMKADYKVMNHYINWEVHKKEIMNTYNLPNPYEPYILIYERGGAALRNYANYFSISGLVDFSHQTLLDGLLKQECLILNHELLDRIDDKN